MGKGLGERETMNTYFVRKSGRLIWEETFEVTIENVNRCVWCTVPDSWFLYSLSLLGVDRKRLYMYKRGILSTKLEKDSSKDLKMRKLNDTVKFT